MIQSKGDPEIDILQLLETLEDTLNSGWPVPGVGRAMVDIDKATELLDQIRERLPEDLTTARQIAGQRDELLEQALAEAQRIREEAEADAAELVRQEGIYKTAERQAQAIIDQARARAEEIRARADEYAIDSLRALESRLSQTLATVQNGIASLQSRAPDPEATEHA